MDISFSALFTSGHCDPAGEADRLFPTVVRQSSLRLFNPDEPIPTSGTRILLGVATWMTYNLRLLDVIDTGLSQTDNKDLVIDVVNVGRVMQEELDQLFPGIGHIFHMPVMGLWRDGILTETASGGAACDRVAKMFGSSCDEITRFVRELQTAPAA